MATALADRHCAVCRPGSPTLGNDQVLDLLKQLDGGWTADTAAEGHRRLTRTFKFKGFMPGVRLVDSIAEIAEAEGHHPDLHLTYGSLRVDLTTHAAGGLTDNDFVLAAKIDRLAPS